MSNVRTADAPAQPKTLPTKNDRIRTRIKGDRRKVHFTPTVWISIVWLVILGLAILLQPWLGLPDPSRSDYAAITAPMFAPGHVLGTDEIGRDILSRVISGGRISLTAGLGAVAFAVLVGGPLGIIAGFFGGITNRIISAVLDIMLAFPAIVALIALSVFLGASLTTIIVGIGIVMSPAVARVSRSATLIFANRDFVTAARSLGAGSLRILWREILPNVIVPILAYAMVMVAVAIVAEASLSFLGLGVPPPTSSWGSMMGTGRPELAENPHIVLIPAGTMFLTLLAINFLAEHFSKRFDIKEAAL